MFDDEDDILDAGSLQEIMDRVIENSMRSAYSKLEEMGMAAWLSDEVPISIERKKGIMEKMKIWFEEREEFEKCVLLRDGLVEVERRIQSRLLM